MLGIIRTLSVVATVLVIGLVVTGSFPIRGQERGNELPTVGQCDRPPILIEDVRVWPDLDRRDVLLRAGVIAELAPVGSIEPPADARRIAGAGATLLPGLIDSHTHLDIWPGPLPTGVEVPTADVAALQTLASGVTSVRNHLSDMDVVPDLVRRSQDDCSPMPRVITGSRGMMGGRPDLDGQLMWGARDAADARDKVRQAADLGDGWVSIHAVTAFADGVLEAIADEARTRDLRLMVEGSDLEAVGRALDIGAHSIDYLDQSAAASYPDDLLERWRARPDPAYAVPPIGYYTRVTAYLDDPEAVRTAGRVRFMPPEFGEALFDAQVRHFRDMGQRGLPGYFDEVPAKFRQLHAAGVPMVVGSDSGSGGQYHADAIWVELRAWRDHGVPVDEAIAAATHLPARMLGLDAVGRITTGARADLVLYEGDLSAGELDLAHVRGVLKGGVLHFLEGQPVQP